MIFSFFYILNERQVEKCCIPSKSSENGKTNFFHQLTLCSLCLTSGVIHYIRDKNIFLTMWTYWVSKNAEFYVEFKNINFPKNKMHQKKVIGEKRFLKNDILYLFLKKTFERTPKKSLSQHRILRHVKLYQIILVFKKILPLLLEINGLKLNWSFLT